MMQVIDHLNTDHNQHLTATSLEFNTEVAFDEWLRSTQVDNVCTFLKRTPRIRLSRTVSYYYCSRSGSRKCSVPTNDRKRHLKVQGYTKINRTCPAHVVKTVYHDGRVHVKYYSKHLCYTDTYEQLGQIRLPAIDRQWLAGKLALQVPIEIILREVRKNLDGQLHRVHINSAYEQRESEAEAHIRQLSPPVMTIDAKKAKLQERALELTALIASARTSAELGIIETALASMKAQLQASRVSTDVSALVTTDEHQKEPGNKNIDRQRRSMSTKRRRQAASSNVMVKPSHSERREIELELLQPTFIMTSEEQSQNSSSRMNDDISDSYAV